MTRKDYRLIARAVVNTKRVVNQCIESDSDAEASYKIIRFTVDQLASVLSEDNERFDEEKFKKACEA